MKKVLISILVVMGVCAFGISVSFAALNVHATKKVNTEYSLNYNGKEYTLGAVFTEEKYGKAENYSEMQSCAFDGIDKTFTYRDYEIYTYPDQEEDKILSIYFLNQMISTTEGIRIGDTFEKMIKVYGEEYEQMNSQYSYHKGKTSLRFIVENNEISSIEYTLDIE